MKIAFGTDAGVSKHGRNADEFELMVKYGMPPVEAIKAATVNAADLLGLSSEIGTIEPGKSRRHHRRCAAIRWPTSRVLKKVELRHGPGRGGEERAVAARVKIWAARLVLVPAAFALVAADELKPADFAADAR